MRVNGTDIAEYTSTSSWGDKAATETWVFTWTLTIQLQATSGTPTGQWGLTAGYAIADRLRGGDNNAAIVNYQTLVWPNPTFPLAATNVTESSSGAVYTITSQRAGDANEYDLRGERVRFGTNSFRRLIDWGPATVTAADANETITVTHTFTFSDA